jgi:hypothetical protein
MLITCASKQRERSFSEMSGCRYCGEMHSPLYICDAMRAARAKAVSHTPVANTMAKTVHKDMAKTVDNVAKDVDTDMAKTGTASTYRYRGPVKRRAYQRELMRKRYAEQKP